MSAVSNVVESELNVQKMCFDKTLIYDVHLLSGETGTLMLSPCTFDHLLPSEKCRRDAKIHTFSVSPLSV